MVLGDWLAVLVVGWTACGAVVSVLDQALTRIWDLPLVIPASAREWPGFFLNLLTANFYIVVFWPQAIGCWRDHETLTWHLTSCW